MVRCFVKGYGLMLSRRKWFDAGSKGVVWCLVQFWVKSTDSSMLGRRVWFDAESKSMVWCWVEWNGLILNQRVWFDAGYCRRGWFNAWSKNWFFCGVSRLPKNNLVGKRKKTNFVGKVFFGVSKELAPRQKLMWREQRIYTSTCSRN